MIFFEKNLLLQSDVVLTFESSDCTFTRRPMRFFPDFLSLKSIIITLINIFGTRSDDLSVLWSLDIEFDVFFYFEPFLKNENFAYTCRFMSTDMNK